jgi:hypothetical protein
MLENPRDRLVRLVCAWTGSSSAAGAIEQLGALAAAYREALVTAEQAGPLPTGDALEQRQRGELARIVGRILSPLPSEANMTLDRLGQLALELQAATAGAQAERQVRLQEEAILTGIKLTGVIDASPISDAEAMEILKQRRAAGGPVAGAALHEERVAACRALGIGIDTTAQDEAQRQEEARKRIERMLEGRSTPMDLIWSSPVSAIDKATAKQRTNLTS